MIGGHIRFPISIVPPGLAIFIVLLNHHAVETAGYCQIVPVGLGDPSLPHDWRELAVDPICVVWRPRHNSAFELK
jgi:hypothetical protein